MAATIRNAKILTNERFDMTLARGPVPIPKPRPSMQPAKNASIVSVLQVNPEPEIGIVRYRAKAIDFEGRWG